jgi:NADP-reducing hydrogenase subunit HndC
MKVFTELLFGDSLPQDPENSDEVTRPYDRLVLVCVKGKSCPLQGAENICSQLREEIFQKGLTHRIRVVKSGCLAQCGHGPVVAVEPNGSWFSEITEEKVPSLARWLLGEAELPQEMLYSPPQLGKNILPVKDWPIPPESDSGS